MTKPLSLEVIQSEFSEDTEAWTLQDEQSGQYVVIPDNRFPGRSPIRFFLRREDAQSVLEEILKASEKLKSAKIFPVKVKLLQALRGIAADTNPDHANAFVIHTPNEVYEYLRDKS